MILIYTHSPSTAPALPPTPYVPPSTPPAPPPPQHLDLSSTERESWNWIRIPVSADSQHQRNEESWPWPTAATRQCLTQLRRVKKDPRGEFIYGPTFMEWRKVDSCEKCTWGLPPLPQPTTYTLTFQETKWLYKMILKHAKFQTN